MSQSASKNHCYLGYPNNNGFQQRNQIEIGTAQTELNISVIAILLNVLFVIALKPQNFIFLLHSGNVKRTLSCRMCVCAHEIVSHWYVRARAHAPHSIKPH